MWFAIIDFFIGSNEIEEAVPKPAWPRRVVFIPSFVWEEDRSLFALPVLSLDDEYILEFKFDIDAEFLFFEKAPV
jgi:hypothetical protein